MTVPGAETVTEKTNIPPNGDSKARATRDVGQLVANEFLHQHHYELLQSSGISDEIILERGYRTVTSPSALEKLEPRFRGGAKAAARFPVLAYPTRRLGSSEIYCWVIRPDNPRPSKAADKSGTKLAGEGATLKMVKYEWPFGVAPVCDVLRRHKDALADPNQDIHFTEGARKADALASCGAVAVDLNGVYGFRGSNGDGGKMLLPDFENIAFNGRRAFLDFDSDTLSNPQVMVALKRLGAVIVAREAHVSFVSLPHMADGQKQGIDDFLGALPAEQRNLEALKPHIQKLPDLASVGTQKLENHPVTMQEQYNPPGYLEQNNVLTFTDPLTGRTRNIYQGRLRPTGWARDYKTGDVNLTVRFRESEAQPVQIVTAPQHTLATAKGVLETLTRRGASISEAQAKDVSRFLISFTQQNREALSYVEHSAHYGYTGSGIVGPGWSVGAAHEYNGATTIKTGDDAAAFRGALAEAVKWRAMPLFLALGLAVVSPFLERLRVTRNPVVWFSGPSNHGKTSVASFAVALYGNPESLSMQAVRSTAAGFAQRLSVFRGLPMLIDEAQTGDPARLQGLVYQYANKQSYAKGGRDGQPLGNETLSGAMFLAGESPPTLTLKGARNRVLNLRVEQHLPLGIGPGEVPRAGQLNGAQRAVLLEKAIERGAGTLGEAVARAVWENWDTFISDVDKYEDVVSVTDGREWLRPLAAAAAGLKNLFDVAELPQDHFPKDLVAWAHAALCTARADNDPVEESFEKLRSLVVNAQGDFSDSSVRVVRGERVAYRSENEWCIFQNSKTVVELLEPFGGLQALGTQWVQRKWIVPDADGKSTARRRLHGQRSRYVVVSDAVMTDGVEPTPEDRDLPF